MELKQYWNVLWKWKWLIAVCTILAGGTAFLVSRSTTPVYRATTTLLVSPGSLQASDTYASYLLSERMASTYAQLLEKNLLLEATFEKLGLSKPTEEAVASPGMALSLPGPLAGLNPWLNWIAERVVPTPAADPAAVGRDFSVSAEPVRDTQLISLRVEGNNPDRITEVANTLVQVFMEQQAQRRRARFVESRSNLAARIQQAEADIAAGEDALAALEAQGEDADAGQLARLQHRLDQYEDRYSTLLQSYTDIDLAEDYAGAAVSVADAAEVPTAPIRPRVMANALLAAVVGAMLGVGVAFLIEYLDDTVKTPTDLQAVDLNLLAAVQQVKNGRRNGQEEVLVQSQPRSIIAESYRTLRTNLQFSSLDRPLRSLVITSAVAAEGKTTTSANLAVVLAQDGKQVVLLDADLRRPNVHKLFHLPNRSGLSIALVDDPAALSGYLRDTNIENLRLLTAGPVPPNPQEMLGSQRMADLLARLEEEADIVVVDTPPTLAVSDANVLAARADGVLLVVNAGQTRREALQQAVEGLRNVGAHTVGSVLNKVPVRRGGGYYYQYYNYYADYRQDDKQSPSRRRGERTRTARRGSKTPERQAEPAPGQT